MKEKKANEEGREREEKVLSINDQLYGEANTVPNIRTLPSDQNKFHFEYSRLKDIAVFKPITKREKVQIKSFLLM